MDHITALKEGIFYGSIFYCLLIVPTCWVFVKTNKARVYQEMNTREPEQVNGLETANVEPPKGQIVMLAGPHFRIPFLHQMYREPIDMVAEKPLTGKVTVYDINNMSATLSWICNKDPIPSEYLPNWYRVKREYAEPYLSNIISNRIAEIFRQQTTEYWIEDREGLNRLAESVLGGPDHDSPEEKKAGTRTGHIVLGEIERTEDAQRVASAKYRMEQTHAEAARLRGLGVSPDAALATAAQTYGIDVTLINVAGLQGVPTSPLVPAAVLQQLMRQPMPPI